jgi:hypothetical protein
MHFPSAPLLTESSHFIFIELNTISIYKFYHHSAIWKHIMCIKFETPGLCCIIIYISEIIKECCDAANIYQYCPHMFRSTHTDTAI